MMDLSQWNPVEVLEMRNQNYNEGITCVGHAKTTGRRCCRAVAGWRIAAAKSIARGILDDAKNERKLRRRLGEIFDNTICFMHVDQKKRIVEKWLAIVVDYLEEDSDESEDCDSEEEDRRLEEEIEERRRQRQARRPLTAVSNSSSGSTSSSRTTEAAASASRRVREVPVGAEVQPRGSGFVASTQAREENERHRQEHARRSGAEEDRRREEVHRQEEAQRQEEARKQEEHVRIRREREEAARQRREREEASRQRREKEEAARKRREQEALEAREQESRKWTSSWTRYEQDWDRFTRIDTVTLDEDIRHSVPWPTQQGSWANLSDAAVKEFFKQGPPGEVVEDKPAYRKMLRKHVGRWHPDQAMRRFPKIEGLEDVLERVTMISQVINGLMEEPRAWEPLS